MAKVDAAGGRQALAEWVLVPSNEREIEAVARQCRRLVNRRAAMAAGVAVLPIPGLDWLTDVGILLRLIPEINEAFGLTPAQIERLAPQRQLAVYKAVSAGGSMVIGKLVSREVILGVLKALGVRLTTQQAAKYIPVAGQALSAALTFTALKFVCEQHIRQCVAVATEVMPPTAPTQAARNGAHPSRAQATDDAGWRVPPPFASRR